MKGRSRTEEGASDGRDKPSGHIAAHPRFTQDPHGTARSQRNFNLPDERREVKEKREGRVDAKSNAPATLGTGETGCTTLALLLAIHGLLGREVWGREDGWI